MSTSQNGWSVDLTGALQDRSEVAGVAFPNGVRKGDVATVLFYVARRFHAEVEPLHPGWCWGWYVKTIEGTSAISNHASGTAIDLNAPAHPMGRRGSFSSAKVTAIHRILADCDGVVRWGGDYTGRPDEMHFEINAGAAAVAKLAAKIGTTEVDMSDVVKGIQSACKAAGFDPGPIDGIWGTNTQAALTAALRSVGQRGPVGPQGPAGPAGTLPSKVTLIGEIRPA